MARYSGVSGGACGAVVVVGPRNSSAVWRVRPSRFMRSSRVLSFIQTPLSSKGAAVAVGSGVLPHAANPAAATLASSTLITSDGLAMVVKLRAIGPGDLDEAAAGLAVLG